MTAYRGFNLKETPQSQPIPGSAQVPNSAGGFAFEISDWDKLDRFLVLGTEGGTYYVKEKELTQKNAEAVMRCIKADGARTVARIAAISYEGRAVKNDPAIFALALCFTFGDVATKAAAKATLPTVCRIGTHLFHFAQYCDNMRGWGRALKSAVANWYDDRGADSLAYQLVKYQQRDGWSHADLIKLSHPKKHADLYNYVLGTRPDTEGRKHEPVVKEGSTPENRTIQGFLHLQQNPAGLTTKEVAATIREYRLPREAVPTQFLNEAVVWEALMDTDMPLEAMIRNLGNMGKVGLLVPMSEAVKKVTEKLDDEEALKRARIHPLKVIVAMRTYAGGKGFRGSGEWPVVAPVVDALDAAFYKTFKHIEPTGKRTMLALDVSGSMSSPLAGIPVLNCREGTAVMAMVTAQVEPNHMFTAFTEGKGRSMHSSFYHGRYGAGISELSLSPRQRLDDVIKAISGLPFGGTDCALPMVYALEKKLPIDTFVIYTDSETWAGNIHPVQALAKYRREMGINAKLVVVGMEANEFSIADPSDPGMLDVVGFDTETPSAISAFVKE